MGATSNAVERGGRGNVDVQLTSRTALTLDRRDIDMQ
jgi:hypothetical protein